jgi:hypothetical protein
MRSCVIRASADALARKYCIKASAAVKNTRTGKLVTSVVAYDKSPDVGATVEAICRDRAALDPEELQATPVEVTMFEECPTECDITVIEHE